MGYRVNHGRGGAGRRGCAVFFAAGLGLLGVAAFKVIQEVL
jgi:hypothetical protein